MGQLGAAMSDAEFFAELDGHLVKVEMSNRRKATLTEIFVMMTPTTTVTCRSTSTARRSPRHDAELLRVHRRQGRRRRLPHARRVAGGDERDRRVDERRRVPRRAQEAPRRPRHPRRARQGEPRRGRHRRRRGPAAAVDLGVAVVPRARGRASPLLPGGRRRGRRRRLPPRRARRRRRRRSTSCSAGRSPPTRRWRSAATHRARGGGFVQWLADFFANRWTPTPAPTLRLRG